MKKIIEVWLECQLMDGSYDVEETTYSYCSQEWTNDVTVDVDKTYESCKGGSGFSSDTKESLLYIESLNECSHCATAEIPPSKEVRCDDREPF